MDETATFGGPNRGPNHRGGGDDPGGIVLPDTAKESLEGQVISRGARAYDDKGTRRPLDVKERDVVIYSLRRH